ncbi:MAG TPA: hypothetical protein VGJ21_17235 [Terracidiphilus sp.]
MQKSVPNAVRSTMYAAESAEPLSVLRELFELLQDYAPCWYTEDLHNRTASVLGEQVLEPVS